MDRNRRKMCKTLTPVNVESNYRDFGWNIKKRDEHFNARKNCFWLLAVALCIFSNFVSQVHCSSTTVPTSVSTTTSRNISMVTSYLQPNKTDDQYDRSTESTTVVNSTIMQLGPKHRTQSPQYEHDKVRHKHRLHKLRQRYNQRGQKDKKLKKIPQTRTTQTTQRTLTTQTTQTIKLQRTQTTQKSQTTKKNEKSHTSPNIQVLQTTSKNQKLQTTSQIQNPQTTKRSQASQTLEETTSPSMLKTHDAKTTEKIKTTEKQTATFRTSEKPQTTHHMTTKVHVKAHKKELPQPTKDQGVTANPTSYATESMKNTIQTVNTTPRTSKRPPIIPTYIASTDDMQCPEKSMAFYNISFVPLWSTRRFPKMYPTYRPHAQWSKTIGRTHNYNYSMWEIGSYANAKVKSFAETGVYTDFDAEVQGNDGILDAFNLPAIGKGFGQSKGSMFVDAMHPLVSFMVKIIPSPDWFVGVSSLNLCSKGKWKKKVIMKLFPVDAGTDIGLTFTSPNWPAYPPEKMIRITSSFPNHEASSFYYKSLKKLPRIAYATFYKVEEYKSVYKRTKPYKSRLPTLFDRLPPLVNKPSVANHSYKPSTNAQTGENPASSPIDVDDEDFGNITNLLAVAENEPAIPLDCQVSNWGEWSPCSKTCGFGRRERFRFVTQERKNNGYLCPQLKEEELCGSMRNCHWKYFKPFLSISQKRLTRTPDTADLKKPAEQKVH